MAAIDQIAQRETRKATSSRIEQGRMNRTMSFLGRVRSFMEFYYF
jgi:hypothetical protein